MGKKKWVKIVRFFFFYDKEYFYYRIYLDKFKVLPQALFKSCYVRTDE